MAYTPKTFTRGGETTTSKDQADEWRLLWEGWSLGPAEPVDRSKTHATLEDLDELAASTGRVPFVFTQASPAAQWTIPHTLGGRPNVRLFVASLPGEPVITDMTYVDDATILVEWPSPEAGSAYVG